MSVVESDFLFALCQKGAEKALKHEVAKRAPSLRPAYQRPGLLTFRAEKPQGPERRIGSILARVSGVSLGTHPDTDRAIERIRSLPVPLRLHVVERDLFRPDETPPSHPEGELAREVEAKLRAALPAAFHAETTAQEGDLVLDVVLAPGDPIVLGAHRHAKGESPHPGGRFVYGVPAEAPSRAYRKTEEAIIAYGLPLREGDVAVELGAAPGGGTLALLRHGVAVTAVDPADMDAKVAAFTGPANARMTHLRLGMEKVEKTQLPRDVQWLLMDVNLAPQVALRAAARFASLRRATLLGVIFTLKLNDWSFLDQLDRFLASVREMGVVAPRARQLPAHRQEIVVAGLTERGQKRLAGSDLAGTP